MSNEKQLFYKGTFIIEKNVVFFSVCSSVTSASTSLVPVDSRILSRLLKVNLESILNQINKKAAKFSLPLLKSKLLLPIFLLEKYQGWQNAGVPIWFLRRSLVPPPHTRFSLLPQNFESLPLKGCCLDWRCFLN